MYIIKNALENIKRHRTKYLQFGFIYLLLVFAVSVAANISFFANEIIVNIRWDLYSTLTLNQSGDTLAPDSFFQTTLSREDWLMHLNSNYVYNVDFVSFAYQPSQMSEITPSIVWRDQFESDQIQWHTSDSRKLIMQDILNWRQSGSIIGLSHSLLYKTGLELNIIEGRMFENEGEAIVFMDSSWELHDINFFSVGDRISFAQDNFFKEFIIVGTIAIPSNFYGSTLGLVPKIFTTIESATYFDIFPQYEINIPLASNPLSPVPAIHFRTGHDAIIQLIDPSYIDAFNQELNILTSGTRNAHPRNVHLSIPVNNFFVSIRAWTTTFSILIFFSTIAAMITTTVMLINSRKYEIAVLRMVGMSRTKIMLGFAVEIILFVLVLTISAYIIGTIVFFIFITPTLLAANEIPIQLSPLRYSALNIIQSSLLIISSGVLIISGLAFFISVIRILSYEPLKIINKSE